MSTFTILFILLTKTHATKWQLATATWYGSANGAGTDGGACGYGRLPGTPYGLDVTAGSPVLYKNGLGCGACYEIKCLEGQLCSSTPVKVVITDECPGGYCSNGRTHFDTSGTAFGQMATQSEGSQLLNAGAIQVLYTRTPCSYEGKGIEFQVADGSSPFWFSVIIRYAAGPGDVGAAHLLQEGSQTWLPMYQVWGANWCINGGPLKAPFTLKLTSLSANQTITAYNVIPEDWTPGRTYEADVNFAGSFYEIQGSNALHTATSRKLCALMLWLVILSFI